MTHPHWQPGQGDLEKRVLTTPSGARAELYRQGAHLTQWHTARGDTGLFLSKQAQFQPGSAIRGGVPIIFPQFNAFGHGPRHGFARTKNWQLLPQLDQNECVLELRDDSDSLDAWPHPFIAQFKVHLQDHSLGMQLQISNPGDAPCTFTVALHTYLAVKDAFQVELSGLANALYWDNNGTDFLCRDLQKSTILAPKSAIDRVYFDVGQGLTLQDQARKFTLEHKGFRDCVVWNPGAEGAASLSDLGDDEYRRMLCVEAAVIDRPVVLAPGESWQGSQTLTLM